ncbi:hypothetical protein Zmor_006359 [Zophobas morio]|uniref:Gustatory receptor n=1 Tax=Zophobas morio TaxID=2755281 RepID=A0AA38MN12_9CUCU|nr:hypothetical protein Zmor_006359 [Zophobas morio]
MPWQPNSVNSFITPIFMVWKYTGLLIFTSKYCHKLKKNIFVSGNCQILPVTTVVIPTVCAYFVSTRIVLNYTQTILAIQFFFIGLMNAITLCFLYSRRKQIVDVVTKFSEAEERISKLTKNRITYKYGDLLLKYVVLRYVFAVVACTSDVVSEPIFKAATFCYHFFWNYQFHLQLVVIVLFLVLKSLYAKVEDHVKQNGFSYSFETVREIIQELDSLIADIQKTFQEIILVETGLEILCTTVGLYYTALTIPTWEFAFSVSGIFYLFLQAVADFSTICFYQFVAEQRKRLVEKVADIYGTKTGTYFQKTVYRTTRHFSELQFVVSGFFSLDYPTIYSMIAGMSTMVVYLFQFRKKEI